MFDGHTSLYEFIADPAKHSLSPLIHNTSFQALHINSVYLAAEIEPEHLEDVIRAMRANIITGINVSMPYKESIIPYLDELTPVAKQLKAVNTVVNRDGHLVGDSTDGEGFLNALQDEGVTVTNQQVVVLGAGGAGRAIIEACATAGATVTVFKRSNATFDAIQHRLTSWSSRITVQSYENETEMNRRIAQADVVVNTTNVGMGADERLPLSSSAMRQLHHGQVVADVIYAPLETSFLRQAQAQGCQTTNGIGMLVHQAAGALTRWTGQRMPVSQVKQVVHQYLENETKTQIKE